MAVARGSILVGILALLATGSLQAQTVFPWERAPSLPNTEWKRATERMRDPAAPGKGKPRYGVEWNTRRVGAEELLAMYAYYGDVAKVQEYLKKNTNVDRGYVPVPGIKGNALFAAVSRDNQTIVQLLIGAGAKLDFQLHAGYLSPQWGFVAATPLDLAREQKNDAMVAILKDKQGITPDRVRILPDPAQYVSFFPPSAKKQPVNGGLVYDAKAGHFRHAVICRFKRPYGNSVFTYYGIMGKDPKTGADACDGKYHQADESVFKEEYEVLSWKEAPPAKLEATWQTMHRSSFAPGFKLPNKQHLIRATVFGGFTKSGMETNYYRYSEQTPRDAETSKVAHDMLVIVERQ